MKRVEIEWLDARVMLGWLPTDSIEMSLARIVTVGYIIKENSCSIAVTTSVNTIGQNFNVLLIPRSSILTIKILEIEEK